MPSLSCFSGTILLLVAVAAQCQDLRVKQRITVDGELVSVTETSVKGNRQRVETELPVGTPIILKQCDLKRSVTLNDQDQTYILSKDPKESAGNDSSASITETIVVTDTGLSRRMFNLSARRLQAKVTVESSKSACTQTHQTYEVDGWYVSLPKEQAACGPMLPPIRIEEGCNDAVVRRISGNGKLGFPITEWITLHTGDSTTVVVVKARSVHTEELDQASFEIPPGYQEAR